MNVLGKNKDVLIDAELDLSLKLGDFIHNARPLGFLSFTLSSFVLVC